MMPIISFAKKHRDPLSVVSGANLMKSLLAAEVPVASSCNGDGVCAKCRIRIVHGQDQVSKPNETEIFLKEKFQFQSDQRISCQVSVIGDIEIDASYW